MEDAAARRRSVLGMKRSLHSSASRRWARSVLVGAAVVIVVTVVSGFAFTTVLRTRPAVAGASPITGKVGDRTTLCDSSGTVTRLLVRRTDGIPQNHVRFSFPSSVVVDETAAVRKVARALCALPAAPRGSMSCPADFGITYHLHFSRSHDHFRAVALGATGCQFVSGLESPRWLARSPRFWRVLGTAMHLKTPSWTTFRGTGPKG